MHVSEKAIALLKHYEQGPGGGVALKPYLCSAGVPTIGWGHTGPDVTMASPPITADYAERLLVEDVGDFENDVESCLARRPTQHQFDAMVCLAYNIGMGWPGASKPKSAKDGFRQSSVLRNFNAGDMMAAAQTFTLWNKSTVAVKDAAGKLVLDAAGKPKLETRPLRGLTERRAREMALFLEQNGDEPPADPLPQAIEERQPKPLMQSANGKVQMAGAALSAIAGAAGALSQFRDELAAIVPLLADLSDVVRASWPALLLIGSVVGLTMAGFTLWRQRQHGGRV